MEVGDDAGCATNTLRNLLKIQWLLQLFAATMHKICTTIDIRSFSLSLPRFLRCSHTHRSSSNKQNDYEIWLLDVLKQNFFQVAERKQAAGTVTKERNEEFSATSCFSTSSSLFSMHCHYQSHNNNNEKRN